MKSFNLNKIYNKRAFETYSIISLVEHQGTVQISSPYPKFVLTGVIKY